MTEITAVVPVVEDIWDVLKVLVGNSGLADEIKTAAHKIIADHKADEAPEPAQPAVSAQELAERAQLAELQAKYGTPAAAAEPAPVAAAAEPAVAVAPPREGM